MLFRDVYTDGTTVQESKGTTITHVGSGYLKREGRRP